MGLCCPVFSRMHPFVQRGGGVSNVQKLALTITVSWSDLQTVLAVMDLYINFRCLKMFSYYEAFLP